LCACLAGDEELKKVEKGYFEKKIPVEGRYWHTSDLTVKGDVR